MRARVLTLVSRPGCHLCQEMRAVIEQALPADQFTLEERDVRSDPELERRYLLEIPVLLAGEREVVRHRVTGGELCARLAALGLLSPVA